MMMISDQSCYITQEHGYAWCPMVLSHYICATIFDMMWTASCHGQPILNKNPIIKMQQATAHLWNYVFGATIPSITAGSLILKPTAWNVFFRVQCRNLKIGNVSILYLKFFLFIFMLQHKNGHFEHYYAP